MNGIAKLQQARTRSRFVAPDSVSMEALVFLDKAHQLLAQAATAEAYEEKIEFAVQASLRAAGAVLAGDMGKKRRKPAGSAWVRLAAKGGDWAEWSQRATTVMRIREDVRLGIGSDPDQFTAERVLSFARKFIAYVEAQLRVLPAAA